MNIVLFIFKHYIPKKHNRFGIKTHKLYNFKEYRNNMNVYLGKERQYASPCMTATHATVTGLNVKLDNVGHKLLGCWYVLSPTRKETSYSDRTLTFASHSKTIQKVVRPTRSPRQQWPPCRTKNGNLSIVFFSRVGLTTYQHLCKYIQFIFISHIDDLHTMTIRCCGNVIPNRKGCQRIFDRK
jgi:hypothetical protein